MDKLLFTILSLVCLFVASCTMPKKIVYFENVQNKVFTSPTTTPDYVIKANDILSVTITSRDEEASAAFNPYNKLNVRSTTATGASTEPGGYLVSTDGFIALPFLGNVQAAGLTKSTLEKNITNLILSKKLLIDPLVEIRYLNYEVTVIGEVTHPTVITVPSEKISLLKALGLAGDLTIYGKRDNVLLIREEDGKKKTHQIDLTSANFFNSPFYYLQPNDVVYVAPNKTKTMQATSNPQLAPIILSSLSVIIIVIDRLVR